MDSKKEILQEKGSSQVLQFTLVELLFVVAIMGILMAFIR